MPVLQHGIKANRKSLETAAQMSLEQGLTPRLMKLDEIFAASAREFYLQAFDARFTFEVVFDSLGHVISHGFKRPE